MTVDLWIDREDFRASSLGIWSGLMGLHVGMEPTSMNNIVVMQVVYRFEHLFDCSGGVFLCEFPIFADAIEKLPASCELSDNIVLILQNSVKLCRQRVCSQWPTFDSNQSWNLTMFLCFIRCSNTISSYTIFSLPLTFFLRMILIAYRSPLHSASRTIPYVPAPRVLPNLYCALWSV